MHIRTGMKGSNPQWANALRALMAARGWSQTDVAKALGTTQPTIHRTLNGSKPRVDLRNRINQLWPFEIPPHEINQIAAAVAGSPEFVALVGLIVFKTHNPEQDPA
jgi:transcriptional regulator with XRE-family HTH domain